MRFTKRERKLLSKHPYVFARPVLRECGFEEPPICEKIVTDHLGLEVKEYSTEGMPDEEGFREIRQIGCCWLERRLDSKSRIWVPSNTHHGRKRWSIFHECGHALIPWHEGVDYLCGDSELHFICQKRLEQEASSCAAELLMPRTMFSQDALSLDVGISAIEQLQIRYDASLEATAIRYASMSPCLSRIVMVEPEGNHKPKPIEQRNADDTQLRLLPELSAKQNIADDKRRYPLRVKYSAGSRQFPTYIQSGAGIDEGNAIFDAWASKQPIRGEIPAAVFGSSTYATYNAECLPLGKSGRVLVLLWVPRVQSTLGL
jgi:Zn-dependent peptidase ImmA (M78 family)